MDGATAAQFLKKSQLRETTLHKVCACVRVYVCGQELNTCDMLEYALYCVASQGHMFGGLFYGCSLVTQLHLVAVCVATDIVEQEYNSWYK